MSINGENNSQRTVIVGLLCCGWTMTFTPLSYRQPTLAPSNSLDTLVNMRIERYSFTTNTCVFRTVWFVITVMLAPPFDGTMNQATAVLSPSKVGEQLN